MHLYAESCTVMLTSRQLQCAVPAASLPAHGLLQLLLKTGKTWQIFAVLHLADFCLCAGIHCSSHA